MTTKRTHGTCTCHSGTTTLQAAHYADCPSLYPAQQEPDALTRLERLIRMGPESGSIAHRDVFAVKALALISEAREEHRMATILAKNEGLEKAAALADNAAQSARLRRANMQTSVMRTAQDKAAWTASDLAVLIRREKDPIP